MSNDEIFVAFAITAGVLIWLVMPSKKRGQEEPTVDHSELEAEANALGSKLSTMTVSDFVLHLRRTDKRMLQIDETVLRRQTMLMAQRRKVKFKNYDGTLSMEERTADSNARSKHGELKPNVICPHCQVKGKVRVKSGLESTTTRVNSIAGQALGIGTNTTKAVTTLYCSNCDMEWND